MIRLRTIITTLGVVATLSLATACGGGSNRGVATLGNNNSSSSDSDSSDAKQDFRDALLDYSKCMREHGVDMPDPTFDDSGTGGMAIIASPGGKGPNPDDANFKSAEAACKPILDAAQKNAPRPSPEEEAKMRDFALKFAQCMRDKGFDVPDPTFDDNGGMKIETRGPDESSASDGGPPAPDPGMQEAAKECKAETGMPGGGLVTAGDG